MADELVPWVRERYALDGDPRRAIIGGHGIGALTAARCALDHPKLFGGVLAQSGAFWLPGDDGRSIARRVAQHSGSTLRFSVEVGTLESHGAVVSNRHLRDVLEARGWPHRYVELSAGDDFLTRRHTFVTALVELQRDSRRGRKK